MTARVGDQLEGPAGPSHSAAVHLLWVLDPADEFFVAEGIGVPAGQRSLVLGLVFTNLGTTTYLAPPDVGLVLVDADGNRHGRAVATLTAYPRFRHGAVEPGESVAGHSYFVLPRAAALHEVVWTATGSEDEPALAWRP